jgi:hypothetical protein
MITYEEWVVEDITASGFEDPMEHDLQPLMLHGIPAPKRIKSVWKKTTRSKFSFSQRIFDLAPDTFQHHQLELVQREQLKIHIKSITQGNGLIVGWMDYPENANIIDPFEKQSDYYDR